MSSPTRIASAGNVMASALAVLKQAGYEVTLVAGGSYFQAVKGESCCLTAEDPLLLLGLAKLFEVRGGEWEPSDAEIDQFLALEAGEDGA
ncbi:hypothetical protein [Piscinibacter gummiphilus]|uniref:Uncharacterized protein n=1 Tax=Piscinibacter gummiphilus TaxID=946333 RepID=A0ABZ0CPK8_9BURK|nr:hypothetical protein [Piscinibacter gummiphilus]WOB06922.1 hypothetical protein RXV79_18590 [Piscinibacter gummiphilus]